MAGTFYPADPAVLEHRIREMLEAVRPDDGRDMAAAIVPHAGYDYSGPVAASAYARVERLADAIERVVLVGPSHFVPVTGVAAPAAEAFATPLGTVAVDRPALAALAGPVAVDPRAHAGEHSLEVQLPFLQLVLPGRPVVPLLTGAGPVGPVVETLVSAAALPSTLVLVSSDLSHYLDDDAARHRDAATVAAITHLDADAIGPDDACGRTAIQALLGLARRTGLRAEAIDVRNSADTAGGRAAVVGYCAVAFLPQTTGEV